MTKQAYFFQGDSLLLPENSPNFQITSGISLDLAENFTSQIDGQIDIFEIPVLDKSDTAISVVSVLPGTALPENWKTLPVRQILTMFAAEGTDPSRILRACHIAQWRRESQFCGTCGAKNCDVQGQVQRECPKCGRNEFPRICPAVIVIITDDQNRILLAHNKRFRAGLYSHISGFNEAGETLEETVVREIREEVNIDVRDIVYVKSQAWPFPNSLMLGFKARYASGEISPDGDEIEDARWFTMNNLPELPGEGSLSRYLINSWLAGTL